MNLRRLIPLAAVAVAVAALTGCEDARRPPAAVKPIDPRRASAKELRDHTAVNGVIAGATAGQQMIVAQIPPVPPVPAVPAVPPVPPVGQARVVTVVGPEVKVEVVRPARTPDPRQPAIKLKARSEKPWPTEQAALGDALTVARVEVMKKLQTLDPPVVAYPTLTAMRNEYLKRHVKVDPPEEVKQEFEKLGVGRNRVWVEVDVEVSDEQVQRLRAGERVNDAARIAALLFAAALAAHGFLRLDAWTKGYLTVWLGIGAVVLVAVALLAVVA